LCYYGNGFTQEGVYRLPVHLRRFYYKQLVDAKKKEKDQVENSKKKNSKVRVRK
jgi:hypothetical protein